MNNQNFRKYLTALAITFNWHSIAIAETKPQMKPDNSLSLQHKLAGPWSDPTLTHSLDSATDINILKFSPNGQLLAGVGASYITLWQVENGEITRILPGHYAAELKMEIAPTAIAFSPDSRFLATATWSQGLLTADSSVVVRDIATGEEILTLANPHGCRQVLFDPSGEILYSACGLGVSAWSFPEGEKLFDFALEYGVEAIALSSNGKIMATVKANTNSGQLKEASNKIQLWELEGTKPSLIQTLDGHDNDIAQLEFTADGRKLVSSSYDGKINVWNQKTGTLERKTNNLYSKDGLFSLSADNRLIAGNFNQAPMASLATGLPLRNQHMIPRLKQTQAIAFNPQQEMFAWTGKTDNSHPPTIQLWQTDAAASDIPSVQNKYLPLPLEQYWGDRQRSGSETTKLNTNRPSPIGKDPQAIALAALGLTEKIESTTEKVELNYPQENLANVTITQNNLADDSVAAIRYLIKFAPYGDRSNEEWRVVWAGRQFKCHKNRGHQNWSGNLCR